MGRDRPAIFAAVSGRTDEPGGLAGLLQRRFEQVEAGQQLAVADEQVADLLAGAFVDEPTLVRTYACR